MDHPLTEYYNGKVDSVAVWSKKLSSSEVKKLYNTGDKTGYHLTTKEYDPDAGLYYFWQRFYDPQNGRFTQRDRFAYHRSIAERIAPYLFCANNPIMFVDPTGLFWICTRDPNTGLYKCSYSILPPNLPPLEDPVTGDFDSWEECYAYYAYNFGQYGRDPENCSPIIPPRCPFFRDWWLVYCLLNWEHAKRDPSYTAPLDPWEICVSTHPWNE